MDDAIGMGVATTHGGLHACSPDKDGADPGGKRAADGISEAKGDC